MGEASAVVPPPTVLTASPPSASAVTAEPMRGASPAVTTSGGRSGRNLRRKVVDELKNVRVRKSPAGKDKGSTRGAPPPPLELNEDVDEEEGEDAVQDPQAAGKARGCSICERSFTVFRAKHTCKMCAQKICDDCSKNRMKLHRRLERKKGSRLCDPCARNYIHAENGSGEDTFPPDASPALMSSHSEYTQPHNQGDATGLSRRHSVPTKTLSSLIHAKDKAPASSPNAVSAAKQAATSEGISKMRGAQRVVHPSHLRTRHWISLLAIAVLVALRVLYYNRRNGVEGSALVPGTAAPSQASPTYSFVELALDNLLSMRTLGTYLLGLVLFDELSRPKGSNKPVRRPHKTKQRRRRRVSTSSGEQQRERTKSSLSDSSVASKRRAVESSAPSSPHTSQEDDLEVSVIEQNHEDEGFTLDKLVAALEDGAKTRAPDGELSLVCFMATCNVICGFLGVFGRATSFAGSTVGAYFTSIEHNLEAWPAPSSSNTWKEQSVKAVIVHEVDLGVADVGGKKKPSCSRCLLRLLWFVQFVEACVRLTLLDPTEDSCYNGASKAYEETLGKRHPWLVRKGVNTALGSIPTRSHILGQLHVGDGDAMEPLSKAHTELVRVIAELKAVFEEHGLTDLK
ncbi:Glycolipid transfer protein (GLTP) [Phytophthora pseudosyringae]|uniref:Glycolipid transfer protein (GLTP) n=1 Tax=Phytophthora pseudosyringae TaxID=221518 RepID=A0A8T1W5D4_9STRA|nr:Glycolipid transfer protein (GLTP) [Phytophthora pseudosyringae]